MKTKVLAMLLALTMVVCLCACGNSAPAATTSAQDSAPAADATVYKVGICQYVQHPALDAATQGFKDVLTEKLGDAVVFTDKNASGEISNCPSIINDFVSDNVDLIMANATPPLQAAASATATIPVLGTSVTDYASALEVENWNGTVGTNVSGTSDLAPLDQQAAMVKELFPDAKTVGLLYCSGEANSVYQCTVIEGYLKDMGYDVSWFSFNDSSDVASVAQDAADKCDVIYIPTDNTAAANAEAIANVIIPAGIPAVVGEEGICSGCGVATLSISYYELGRITGEMAYDILVNGADVSTMPVEFAPTVTPKYNAANVDTLGITIPANYEVIG